MNKQLLLASLNMPLISQLGEQLRELKEAVEGMTMHEAMAETSLMDVLKPIQPQRTDEEKQAKRGSKLCQCGKPISVNAIQCFSCSK